MKKDKIVYTYIQGETPKPFIEDNRPQIIKIFTEKRGGRSVTIISGFKSDVNLNDLASELKKITGSGGTIKEESIEIQGEKKDLINEYLKKKGFKTKVV